ncbi:hypothetical protein PIB30_016164 [Stylosanthes scabra]|uniref:Cytochrome b561 domain-containing protein n=1 Tax=Stylosanthes scabra TaxID=79078 RepID=A0ABU6T733_9FABA|nr:hypothetical protein [Stylosanthes scabra]
MTSYYFLILLLILFADEFESKISHNLTPGNNSKRTIVVSYRDHQTLSHHTQLHLQKVHGILILVGWGTLLPIGAIIARYFREVPIKWKQWFWCHIVCQTMGYIVGTIGWCIGIWLRTLSKHFMSKLQLALTIIAFTILNLQMVSVLMRPNKEGGYGKWWNIWHHATGYAAIVMVAVSIFAGISTTKEAEKLEKAYTVIIAVLIAVAVPLQIYKFKSTIKKQFMRMATSLSLTRSQSPHTI